MKKSTRALLGFVLLEALILGGTFLLAGQVADGANTSVDPAEAITTITSIGGAVAGFVGVILLIAYFVHRGRERRGG